MSFILKCLFAFSFLLLFWPAYGQEKERIHSRIDTIEDGSIMLVQEFQIMAPLEEVWKAYTTKEGWEGWAVPLAEVDFKINGNIRTNYNKGGTIGDSTTIVTHILNFIPYKLITLQAEIGSNFPDFMQQDSKDFYNIIEFKETNESTTEVISYGIGYKNNEKYARLLEFFISGNTTTQIKLINYLEQK